VIGVRRPSVPVVLSRNASRWANELQAAVSSAASSPAQIERARNKYRHNDVKHALVAMFHGKCAYCESKIVHVTYGAIEHFRPKGDARFQHLTFEWTNLLLSCDVCNDSAHKGRHFPLDNNGNPLLLDPSDPNIDLKAHLRFDWDGVAKIASVYGIDASGREVERTFDLNGQRGRVELLRHRSTYVAMLVALRVSANGGSDEAEQLLGEACEATAEYSAFARAVLGLP